MLAVFKRKSKVQASRVPLAAMKRSSPSFLPFLILSYQKHGKLCGCHARHLRVLDCRGMYVHAPRRMNAHDYISLLLEPDPDNGARIHDQRRARLEGRALGEGGLLLLDEYAAWYCPGLFMHSERL